MRECHLPVGILQQVTESAVQDARRPTRETRGVLAQLRAASAGLNADQFHIFVADECMEQANGIAAAADASESGIRQAAFALENLGARFDADHAMEIADHHGIWMCAQRGAQ